MSMLLNSNFNVFDKESSLEPFVIPVPTVPSHVDGQTVKEMLDQNPDIEGIVVMDNDCPAGIIMRTTFFQKIGSLYGHSVYMKRPVGILMDRDFMKADVRDNIYKTSIQAMNREQSKLYDYLVVYENKMYIGVISIRLFLVELSKRNEAQIRVLKNQQQKLLSAHEQEFQLRKNLEYQTAAVRNLLDHADQGFLWFGEDLIIKNEYSYKCVAIFERTIGETSYLELVRQYFDEDKGTVFQMAFDSYFKNNSQVTDNVYLMLLPSNCLIQGKNIHFEYRRIESNGQKAVMVIINDITEKVSMEKAAEDDRNRQRLLIKAFTYQAQIKQMLEEFREIFSGGYRSFFRAGGHFSDGLNELFRTVHTYKGDFAQYGFISASDQLHEFEDALLAVIKRGESAAEHDVASVMAHANPETMLAADLNIIYEVLGNHYFDQSEMISFPKTKLMEVENAIRNTDAPLDQSFVISLLESLKWKNIKVFLNQYQDYLQYLAGRMMKNAPVYLVEGDDIEIDVEQYGNFIKSLVHIFRNIMDHGLETDEERFICGKAERGVVECRISRLNDNRFTLCIADDGRGIDLNKITEKARENHLKTAEELNQMTEDEICSLIFIDHLSTKDYTNTLSGRGMGMSAILKASNDLGGKVAIVTEENKGTSFQFELPY